MKIRYKQQMNRTSTVYYMYLSWICSLCTGLHLTTRLLNSCCSPDKHSKCIIVYISIEV